MFKCPVPNCGHAGIHITKLHYRTEHNMTREEAESQFGQPVFKHSEGAKYKKPYDPRYTVERDIRNKQLNKLNGW